MANMLDLLQHAFVTFAAIAAAWIIVRRVFRAVLPGPTAHKCASCPAAQGSPSAPLGSQPSEATLPLILVKSDSASAPPRAPYCSP
jgi:hypothetical protein